MKLFLIILTLFLSLPKDACSQPPTIPISQQLITFTAEKLDKKTKLKWKIDSEINIKKYSIDRSEDGITFNQILSKKSHGNSSGNSTYVVFDDQPLNGTSFYRLNSLNHNGDTAFAKIIVFNNEYLADELPIFNMYPNPLNEQNLTIEFVALLSEDAQIVVTDINGKTIHQSLITSHVITLKLSLSQGLYLVSVITPADRIIQKLVVD